MYRLQPDHTWHRRTIVRDRTAFPDPVLSRHPTPSDMLFDIGLTLAATLGVALAGNLLAAALGG